MLPTVLEVDMWFRDRTDPDHPRDSHGNLNFEVIEALKIQEFNEAVAKLINGDKVKVPNFSFKTGCREGFQKEPLSLDPQRGVLIMEGIFCLNPKLFECDIISNIDDIAFKIFICPISPFYSLDNYHFISEQTIRLIRRISRDHFHRNKEADQTVFKWGQLKMGEDENIFPYVKYADAVFNSALTYEIAVLKTYSYPLLQTVTPQSRQYKDAQNLLSFLDCFFSMPDSSIPADSLLMEFIGHSIFDEL
jgi:uridine kinase